MSISPSEQREAHQAAEAERDSRDPKAPTWGLLLLYPVAALAIWIGMFLEPGTRVSEKAQWLLTLIGGVWFAWVSIRLLIRERHRHRTWVHYVLGALAVVGVVVVMFAVDGENNLHDNWLLTMGDPSQCTAEDRASLDEDLKFYGEVVGDEDFMTRKVARSLNYYVRYGCLSREELERRKYEVEKGQPAQ
jgi:hypothetical protein